MKIMWMLVRLGQTQSCSGISSQLLGNQTPEGDQRKDQVKVTVDVAGLPHIRNPGSRF